MLIGADFFLSHRIYVASSQHKLFFTYNGGPVFNLTASRWPTRRRARRPARMTAARSPRLEPADAADYSRRGAALLSRHDYEHAIADLTRACEMATQSRSTFYQRGVVSANSSSISPAPTSNRALELKPDDLSALPARALRLKR